MAENEKLIIDQYYCWLICVYCHLKNIQTFVHVQPFNQQHPL
jgi:hypothetical protein